MKTMVPSQPVSVIHHEGEVYKPGEDGTFRVQDGHVDALRAHGLRLEGEKAPDPALGDRTALEKKVADQADQIAAQPKQLEDLQAQIATLAGAPKK